MTLRIDSTSSRRPGTVLAQLCVMEAIFCNPGDSSDGAIPWPTLNLHDPLILSAIWITSPLQVTARSTPRADITYRTYGPSNASLIFQRIFPCDRYA
jgi:hypothetical protein